MDNAEVNKMKECFIAERIIRQIYNIDIKIENLRTTLESPIPFRTFD